MKRKISGCLRIRCSSKHAMVATLLCNKYIEEILKYNVLHLPSIKINNIMLVMLLKPVRNIKFLIFDTISKL